MASPVNVSEDDYMHLHAACICAWEHGEHDTAQGLNRLGRKINAALSVAAVPKVNGFTKRGSKGVEIDGPLDDYLKRRSVR